MNTTISRIKTFFTTLNKWQTVVLILGIGVTAWLLITNFVFKPTCMNAMCPAVDPTLWPRIGFLAVCTVLAIWLLKDPKPKEQ
jgi:hypothetical protein